MQACGRQQVRPTPVWFMRQAGRYMPAYREVRQRYSLLEICRTPQLAAEVTLQPVRRFHLDAAIIFADILLPLQGMGVGFQFVKGSGPVIDPPIRSPDQIRALVAFDPAEQLSYVLETVRLVRGELDPAVSLIGFAGGPFTVASYMIEGGSSRHFTHTKLLMYRHESDWQRLMEKVSQITIRYLRGQLEAGANAVQLFDSWIGCLAPDDYRRYVLPYSKLIFESLKDLEAPLIHFGTGTSCLLELLREAGGTVIGVDWRIPLDEAWRRLGDRVAVQGNLDPVALLGPLDVLEEKVDDILARVAGRPGHIFNLGHGILPQTPVENVATVVDWVHQKTAHPSQ